MFDPTIFENLKVALENQLYDLDNLDRRIRITHRVDRLEMSVLSREFALQFQLAGSERVTAEIRLEASLKDLAAEILEMPDLTPGCTLTLRFYMQIEDIPDQCRRIEETLMQIWEPVHPPTQTLSFVYGGEHPIYNNRAEVTFDRNIGEEQMGDVPDLIEHVLHTLASLDKSM